jgi:hypothetical protein
MFFICRKSLDFLVWSTHNTQAPTFLPNSQAVSKMLLALRFVGTVYFRCVSPSQQIRFKAILTDPTHLFSLLWVDWYYPVDIGLLLCYLPRETIDNFQIPYRSKSHHIKFLLPYTENYTGQKKLSNNPPSDELLSSLTTAVFNDSNTNWLH